MHNTYVQSKDWLKAHSSSISKLNAYQLPKVPTEDLLVWNVKDGWEPLCEFLKCSVPPIPIPHDNRTGDTKYVEEYVFKSDFMKRSLKKVKTYIILDLFKCGIFVYVAWKFYKSNSELVE